jgi:histidinol dehydrogenase
MDVKIVRWPSEEHSAVVEQFLTRPAFDVDAEVSARAILDDVRVRGDLAVIEYARRFDRVSLEPGNLAVEWSELVAARENIDAGSREAVREAHKRVAAFARSGMKEDWQMSSPRGGILGEQYKPLERVGIYVPGGSAPLASTVIMTVTLAKVAGVAEIVVCTPSDPQGRINPVLLHALEVAGATEVYRVGGAQAIGMMAYGTASCRKVRKIVGPGNTYVTAAKKLVYGQVALDLVAGPSEVAVLADDTASARFVAADLLSQAEHGSGWEKAMLATPSAKLARDVQAELASQSLTLRRRPTVEKVMAGGMLLVVVNNLDDGMALCNRFAPEHLEIITREPRNWLRKVTNAGAVFVGSWSPEAVGDFVAGPSHVLPTGGAAAMFSGLTVEDFRKRTSIVSFTRADLHDVLPHIEAFSRVEGLDAHARSAQVRFEPGAGPAVRE